MNVDTIFHARTSLQSCALNDSTGLQFDAVSTSLKFFTIRLFVGLQCVVNFLFPSRPTVGRAMIYSRYGNALAEC